ncbi:MAG: protein DA1 [Calditrichaeota bacterium]|nr:protein DA1 [Calditrichota bacterium]
MILILLTASVSLAAGPPYICAVCGKEITRQAGVVDGKLYHPECFRCTTCGEAIQGDYFRDNDGKYHHKGCFEARNRPVCAWCGRVILDRKYTGYRGKSYHNDCFKRRVAPICDICGEALTDSSITDFWGTQFHSRHAGEFPICTVCGRLIARDGRIIARGRHLCPICLETAVTDPAAARALLEEVREQLASIGIVVTTLGLRIELVTGEWLAASRSSDVVGPHPYAATRWQAGNPRDGDETAVIYVQTSLPEDLTRGIIAHEMMHVWQHEHRADNLPSDLREGSANWASSLIYNRSGTGRGRFFINNFEKSPDPVYGEGYRKIGRYADSRGVEGVLDLLRIESALAGSGRGRR